MNKNNAILHTSELKIRPTPLAPGYRQLNPYLRELLYKRIQQNILRLCKKGDFKLDEDYWECIADEILKVKTADDALIVAARAGYGKSVFIKAFVLAVASICEEKPEYAEELTGMVIVLQKVEDLNDLVKFIREYVKTPGIIVALQGWTSSAQKEGYCQNPDVHTYHDCNPRKCRYESSCKVRSFLTESRGAFIIGLTQARFKMYLDAPQLEDILNRQFPSGKLPRRYIFFDENPNLSRISAMTKETINQASNEFNQLVRTGQSKDYTARLRQSSLSYTIDGIFQELRRSTLASLPDDCYGLNSSPIEPVVGYCSLSKDMSDKRSLSYQNLKYTLERYGKGYTPTLKTLFTVADKLYNNEQCIYCRSNGFAIFDIKPPQLHFEKQLSVIFDATADVDGDYARLGNIRFLPRPPAKDMKKVTFHIYTDPIFSVSKKQLALPWKLRAFAHFIRDTLKKNPVPTFLCAYKTSSRPLYELLSSELPDQTLALLALMPNTTEKMFPYLGGTNGSNNFNHCTQMIMLGNPMLNPETYLTHTCAAYGIEPVMNELEYCVKEYGPMEQPWDMLKLPSIADYAVRHTAARLEQEIYRLALRNYNNKREINIHLFYPGKAELDLLMSRFCGATVVQHDYIPDYFSDAKAIARNYKGEQTFYGRLSRYIRSNPTLPAKIVNIKAELEITDSGWRDLMKQNRVKMLMQEHRIRSSGRGPNAVWQRIEG